MNPSVAVVGGGYGGIAAARALDDVADVLLVEPRDRFVHNVAALRGLVDPDWTGRIFLPYDRLLARGRVLRDRAVRVDAAGVVLGSGDRITPDYLVLATGSAYPFPAKTGADNSADATARFRAAHRALAQARRVLLLGAGPAGLELAGEITSAWADKAVTLVDPAADVLAGGFTGEFRAELRRQLAELGVELMLGTSLREDPPTSPARAGTFTVTTQAGRQVTADIWFRCFGVTPVTGYLAGELASARRADGYLDVTAQLRLPGRQHVFAIGDITAIPEAKTAKAAGQHAEVAAGNIRTLIEGGRDLIAYHPGPPGISLPLGPKGGASYSPGTGILDAATTSERKGADLRVSSYLALLGYE